MITKCDNFCTECLPEDYIGLSSDEKPTDVPNTSSFYEMDTKTLFLFDAQNGVWLQQ